MKIYSIQMAKWRKAKELGVELIDTTVKSGDLMFAPDWEMVLRIKQATEETKEFEEKLYTGKYSLLMRQSFTKNREAWKALLEKENIAIACYCKVGVFCHRHLLIKYLLAAAKFFNIEASYEGEIT